MHLKPRSTNTSEQTAPLTDSTSKRPDPGVPERKTRRRFTAKYKLKILSEIDACTDSGEVGAILGKYLRNI